ncbi:MAG: hypothetical protein F6K16_11315 [Symploca sp. SIO2B6]|nr:hypothetical protein [Symploca sp. SIO2B6]
MTIKPENNDDSLSLNFNVGGNSSPAKPSGYNGSPLAASQMVLDIVIAVPWK